MALLFSNIQVTKQAFYRSSLSFAIVNLKPIVPGHVLVIPQRVVPRMGDMTSAEISDLFESVQAVGKVVERAFGADALTVACQDGKAAGQSVPHVHVHILPRRSVADHFANNDDVYPAIESSEQGLSADFSRLQTTPQQTTLKVDADEDRKPRSMEEMEKEARWLETWVEKLTAKHTDA